VKLMSFSRLDVSQGGRHDVRREKGGWTKPLSAFLRCGHPDWYSEEMVVYKYE